MKLIAIHLVVFSVAASLLGGGAFFMGNLFAKPSSTWTDFAGPAVSSVAGILIAVIQGIIGMIVKVTNGAGEVVAGPVKPFFGPVGTEIGKLAQTGKFDDAEALLNALKGKP